MVQADSLGPSRRDSQSRDERRRDTRMRFAQWAHNPTCQANTFSAVYNVRMAEVAKAEGYKPTFGQSPFAIARGDTFERTLFRDRAKILIEALNEQEVLPPNASCLIDLRIRANGGRVPTLDEAIEATKELVADVSSATGRAKEELPSVVAGATVRIPRGVMLPEAILILDVLAIRTDGEQPELIVGEIKTYPDRGGHTDSRELALARAQAGIYLHALQLVVEELKIQDQVRLSRTGFLVLTKPGSNRPSVRAGEDLRFQAERARRGFDLLEKAALELPKIAPDRAVDAAALVEAVMRAESTYSEACLSFCDRAEKCFRDALTRADPIILGEDVLRFLGKTDLNRAGELLNGARPANPAEKDLVRRIHESDLMAGR